MLSVMLHVVLHVMMSVIYLAGVIAGLVAAAMRKGSPRRVFQDHDLDNNNNLNSVVVQGLSGLNEHS